MVVPGRNSVVYFDRVTAFKVLQRRTSVKCGAHMCYVDLSGIRASILHSTKSAYERAARVRACNSNRSL